MSGTRPTTRTPAPAASARTTRHGVASRRSSSSKPGTRRGPAGGSPSTNHTHGVDVRPVVHLADEHRAGRPSSDRARGTGRRRSTSMQLGTTVVARPGARSSTIAAVDLGHGDDVVHAPPRRDLLAPAAPRLPPGVGPVRGRASAPVAAPPSRALIRNSTFWASSTHGTAASSAGRRPSTSTRTARRRRHPGAAARAARSGEHGSGRGIRGGSGGAAASGSRRARRSGRCVHRRRRAALSASGLRAPSRLLVAAGRSASAARRRGRRRGRAGARTPASARRRRAGTGRSARGRGSSREAGSAASRRPAAGPPG